MNSLSSLGESLRSAYAGWLGEQMSGWLPADVGLSVELNPLFELDAATAIVQEQGYRFTALETSLSAGFLPPDLGRMDLQAVPSSGDTPTRNRIVPTKSAGDDASAAAEGDRSPNAEATPPFQGSGPSTGFGTGIGQKLSEGVESAQPPESPWFKKAKGLHDLAAFVQSHPEDAAEAVRPSGNTPASSTRTNRVIRANADVPLAISVIDDSNSPPRDRRKDLLPSLLSTADDEEQMNILANFLKKHQAVPGAFGISETHQEPVLPEPSTSDEVPGSPSSKRGSAVYEGTHASSASHEWPSMRSSPPDPGDAAKQTMGLISDRESNSPNTVSQMNSASFDLDGILDAIAEEAERDFKRIYGR